MVAGVGRSHVAEARADVAGKLVGRGEPGARTARAGDELGAESPGMPVILVIMMASCWARKPERWWRPVRRSAELPVELKHCWVRRAISGVLLSSRKTLTARAIRNAMAEHRGATGLPLTV